MTTLRDYLRLLVHHRREAQTIIDNDDEKLKDVQLEILDAKYEPMAHDLLQRVKEEEQKDKRHDRGTV